MIKYYSQWLNESYQTELNELLQGYVTGRVNIPKVLKMSDISDNGREGLRKYSLAMDGVKDGKYLNNHIDSKSMQLWIKQMDEAFVWTVTKPIILWRGWSKSQSEVSTYKYFLSCSMVERVSRKFATKTGVVTAILIEPGTKVAFPLGIWNDDLIWYNNNRHNFINGYKDNEKLRSNNIRIIRDEGEVILPRNSTLQEIFSKQIKSRIVKVVKLI